MTPIEKKKIRERYPNHWIVKVIGYGIEVLIAIPRNPEKDFKPLKTFPDLCPEMLHGAVVKLDGRLA